MSTANAAEVSASSIRGIEDALGADARSLLDHKCQGIPKDVLHLPGPDVVDRVYAATDRPVPVLRNLQHVLSTGRLAGTGYVSILPVDQGIEHSGGASFAKNVAYFDPEQIVKLAIEGGCNAVASTLGVLGSVARRYAHKIPFIVKVNHNEFLSYPNKFDQILFGRVEQAYDMGAAAVGATIYFGSDESTRQLQEVARAFEEAHDLGMFTVLWCYLRNNGFKKDGVDYSVAADLTGQANHMGVTIQADIIKQKLPENNGGYLALDYGKTSPLVYDQLTTDNPIDLTRWQVANCYMGRIGLINSVASRRAPATWRRRCAPPSSTSGPVVRASSRAARPSRSRWPRASSSSTPSRTSTPTAASPSRRKPAFGLVTVHGMFMKIERPGVPSKADRETRSCTWGRVANDRHSTSRQRGGTAPGGAALRRRLRRRHAAHRRSVHLRERAFRQ